MTETQTYCDICDRDDVTTICRVCEACWMESVQPGGVHAEVPLTLTVEGDSAREDLTLGAFVLANKEVLAAEDICALTLLPTEEPLAFGGGAAPVFWLSRREDG